ncbi:MULTISPECIES: LuxR family transcriptional regulator [unclassified Aureimonas]|uniref:LuxR family transcriptional regulator n=1 Tax=unclassified Aureimonas TaxID=2615206 RepID=UPI000AF2FBD9|nr:MULTISPECIES: LuxR family transcriptional regulator [unclassified Aureimonas]
MAAALAILAGVPRPWDEIRLAEALAGIALAYGYRHYSIFHIPAADDARAEMKLIVSNWEPAFLKAYEKLGLLRFSPVIRALKAGPTPFPWDADMLHGFDEPDEPNPPARLLAANGFHGGVYLPVHGMTSFHGALGFAGDRVDITEAEMGELQLAAFGVLGMLATCRFEDNKRANPLTPRERDCLKLAMLGKTSSEIGTILSLSEHTVSQHLTTATRKVNASNRTHAVAVAAQLGYLS